MKRRKKYAVEIVQISRRFIEVEAESEAEAYAEAEKQYNAGAIAFLSSNADIGHEIAEVVEI